MPSRSRLTATLGRILGSVVHAAAITALAFGNFAYAAAAGAAETPTEPAAEGAGFSAAELEELVGPVALYPDELLAIALPAATYPLQIVQAARFLEKRKTEPELEPDEEWDASILGLLNYPEVIGQGDGRQGDGKGAADHRDRVGQPRGHLRADLPADHGRGVSNDTVPLLLLVALSLLLQAGGRILDRHVRRCRGRL
jgi:hypothetical protein